MVAGIMTTPAMSTATLGARTRAAVTFATRAITAVVRLRMTADGARRDGAGCRKVGSGAGRYRRSRRRSSTSPRRLISAAVITAAGRSGSRRSNTLDLRIHSRLNSFVFLGSKVVLYWLEGGCIRVGCWNATYHVPSIPLITSRT